MEILKKVHNIYQNNINNECKEYLHKRGISDKSIEEFELGFHSPLVVTNKIDMNIKGLSETHFFDYFSDGRIDSTKRVIYPLHKYTFGGFRLIGFHSRAIEDAGLPHRHLADFYYNIFNERALEGVNEIIITEGQNDCIILNQNGFNAIGLLGAFSFNVDNAETVFSNGIKKAFILFDNDNSGVRGALKTAGLLSEFGISCKIGILQKVKEKTDINDLYLFSKDNFKNSIGKTIRNSLTFKKTNKKKEYIRIENKDFLEVRISDLYDFDVGQRNEIKTKCMLPGHAEDNASFFFNARKNVFYCFGCNKGGGPIEFFAYLNNMSKEDAIKYLNERSNKIDSNIF